MFYLNLSRRTCYLQLIGNFELLKPRFSWAEFVIMANFVMIGQAFAEIWQFIGIQPVSQLEFNVPLQHKYGYIRDEKVRGGEWLPSSI